LKLFSRYPSMLIIFILIITIYDTPSGSIFSASINDYPVYAYEFSLNTSIDNVVVLSSDLVAILGNLGGTSVVQFINISDPLAGPQTIFTYPLTGNLMSYAVDGYPVNYLAVGTDLGEIVVFSIFNGRLYEKLHYIQGADYVVRSLYLLRTPATTKLLALSINANLPSERYLYVFDINTKSVLRLGPLVGNFTYAVEGITPYVVAPAKIITNEGYYYDPSHVFVSYTGLMATLVINATYMYNGTLLPASNAYLEIRIRNTSTGSIVFTYDINLNERGEGEVLAPIGYLVDVIAYDVYGNSYRSSIDLSGVLSPELRFINITLYYPPNIKKALVGMPMFIKVFDFSEAPIKYNVSAELFIPNYRGTPLYILKPINLRLRERGVLRDPYLIITKHSNYLNLTYMYDDYVLADVLLYDYLGYGSGDVKFIETDANATYLIVALSDGRIKVYRCRDSLSNQHWFEQEYVSLGTPLNLKLSFIKGKSYYMLYTTGGLQVISLEPVQTPILRLNSLLTFNIPGARHADSLPDLSLIAIGGGNRLVIIKDLNKYLDAHGPQPIDLSKVKLPSMAITVLTPERVVLPNAKVVLKYGNICREFTTDGSGSVVLGNAFPGEYLVSIYPQIGYLNPANLTIYVPPKVPHITYEVVLNYTEYELNLFINDEIEGGPQVPLDIYVNDVLLASNYSSNYLSTKLLRGNYSILIKPQRNYAYFYEPLKMTLALDKDLTLNITLSRKSYNVTINIIDSVSKELINDEVVIAIAGEVKSIRGSLTMTLKAGEHVVNVLVPSELSGKYSSVSAYIKVITDSTIGVEVPRRNYAASFTLIDVLTKDSATGLFDIYINGSRILTSVNSTFNLTLPYGAYIIGIRPRPPYDSVYLASDLILNLMKDSHLTAYLDRVKYLLTIVFYDPISRVPIVPLKLIINNTLYNIDRGTPSFSMNLPYGAYIIRVLPEVGFEGAYEGLESLVNLTSNAVIELTLNRRYYELNITIFDVTSGPVIGLLDVEANGTLVSRGVKYSATVLLPYGNYLIKVKPQPPYAQIYMDSEVIIDLRGNRSVEVLMSRKYYTLAVLVRDDKDSPLMGAEVTLIDTVTGSTVGKGVTGSDGKFVMSLYYGSYKLIVRYGGFYDYSSSIELITSITEKVVLTPTPLTILIRNLPLIIVVVVIISSIAALIKLRGKIIERLSQELF